MHKFPRWFVAELRRFMADESGELATLALVAGAAVSAVGAITSGIAAKQQADAQATIFRQQATDARQVAKAKAEDFARRQSRLAAARRAAIGGAGVQLASGSPLLVSEDIAAETELGRLRILRGGEVRATRLHQEAGLTTQAGQSAATAGFLTGIGGFGTTVFAPEPPPPVIIETTAGGSLLITGKGKKFT